MNMVLPHVNIAYTIFIIKLLYNNLTTLCLDGTLSCVDFVDVRGDVPYPKHAYKYWSINRECAREHVRVLHITDVMRIIQLDHGLMLFYSTFVP